MYWHQRVEGASSLQLVVWEFNKDAIDFYKKIGMSTRNRFIVVKFCKIIDFQWVDKCSNF